MDVVQVTDATIQTAVSGGTAQPSQIQQVEWKITKATTGPDGVMRWRATTTKFSRDVQGDYVKKAFYEEAIKRFKSGLVPAPFFSVAHYPLETVCLKCGYVYKSMMDTRCGSCHKERLIAGIATDLWIDGEQPKARGIYFPTILGKSVFVSCRKDIEQDVPFDERVRISMGFYPDPDGIIVPKSGWRDFEKGWIEHFAATRVPVVPETPIEVALEEKSLSIKTKYDDAVAVLSDKSLADELEQIKHYNLLKSESLPQLITKAEEEKPGEETQEQPKKETVAEEKKEPLEVVKEPAEEPKEEAADETTTLEETVEAKNVVEEVPVEDKKDEIEPTLETLEKPVEQRSAEEPGEETKKKSEAVVGALMKDAADALDIVQKAILAPGTNKQEVIARAANLVNAIRDYVQVLNKMPENIYGQIPAGIQDVNQLLPVMQPLPPPGEVLDRTAATRPEALSIDDVLSDLQEPTEAEAEAPSFEPIEEEEEIPEEEGGEEELEIPEEEEITEGEEGEPEEETGEEEPTEEPEEEEPIEEGTEEEVPEEETSEEVPEEEVPEEGEGEETEEEKILPEEMKAPKKKPIIGGKKLTFSREGKSVVDVKTRAKPIAAVKSAVASPAEAFMDRWSKGVTEIMTNGQLTRTEMKSLIQNALQQFVVQAEEIIDHTMPATESDIAVIVQKAVERALVAKSQAEQTQMGILEQKVKELTEAIVSREVSKAVRGPIRKSLDNRVMTRAPAIELQVGDDKIISTENQTSGLRKYSASDVARASTAGGNPLGLGY